MKAPRARAGVARAGSLLVCTAALGLGTAAPSARGAEPEVAPGGPETEPVPSLPEPAETADAELPSAEADLIAESSDLEALGALSSDDIAEVVVRRVRRAPGSYHAVSDQTLQRHNYDNPHQVLSLVPGVYLREEDGFGLRPNIGIRGATSDRSKKVALMEDGILFAPAPYSAPAAYYFPLLARAYQLRVIKGPAGIQYGPQTIGGAINFITRPIPIGSEGGLDLAIGLYGHAKLHARYGYGTAESGIFIEGVHLRSDGFKELPDGADTGFYRNEWALKAKHTLAPDSSLPHEVSLGLSYSDEASNETYLGLTDADFRAEPLRRYPASALDRMEWRRYSMVLKHRLEPAPDLILTTSAYHHELSRVWRKLNGLAGASVVDVLRNPSTPANTPYYEVLTGARDGMTPAEAILVGPNNRDFVSQGVQLEVAWQTSSAALSHRLEYGIRFHHDRVERLHSEDAYQMLAGQLARQTDMSTVTTRNAADSLAVALHALDTVRWGAFTLTPGLRVELIRSTFSDQLDGSRGGASVQVPLPGIGVHYALTPELGFLGGVHRGMSPPAPGADSSEPELSINYEAGARYLSARTRLELIGYFNDYSNLADQCTFSSGCSEENIDVQFSAGKARIYGFEAVAEHEFSLGPLRLPASANYTLTRTAFLSTFQSADPAFGEVEAGDEMPYVPEHQARASIGLDYLASGVYLAGNYVGAMREQAGQGPIGVRTDRQMLLEAGAHHELMAPVPVRFYANVQNLLGESFIVSRRPFGARPNPPFLLQAGAKLRF